MKRYIRDAALTLWVKVRQADHIQTFKTMGGGMLGMSDFGKRATFVDRAKLDQVFRRRALHEPLHTIHRHARLFIARDQETQEARHLGDATQVEDEHGKIADAEGM